MATIMRKMNIISRLEELYRTEQSSLNLQGIYHSYILAICNNPGMTQAFLSKHLCKNKSSVTRHLSFLEKEGFIIRKESSKDKRESLVYPTQKTLDVLPEIKEITLRWNSLLAEDISEEQLSVFHSLLDKMLNKSKEIVYKEVE